MSDTITERVSKAKIKVTNLRTELQNYKNLKLKEFKSMKELASKKPGYSDKFVSNPKIRRVLKGHFGKVYSMYWSGDSQHLVSASQDGKLIVWNGHAGTKTQAIPLRSSWVMTCTFEQSKNNLVACGGLDNLCSIYQQNQAQLIRSHRELAAHDGYLSCCRFIGEETILTSSGDSKCIVWDVELGQPKTTFSDHDSDVMSVSVLPDVDPNMFVSGSCDSLAKVWDIRTGKCTMTFRGHESDINSVTLFPDGKSFGTGSDDSSCRVFDMRSAAQISDFRNELLVVGITSVSFSKSGRILFAGYDDYNCLGWDVLGNQDKNIFQLHGHENRVSCVGVSPSGDALCTGSWDTTLKIWA